MKEKNEREPRKIEEIELTTRLSRNPAIWFGLILIPVFLGLLIAFVGPDEAPVEPALSIVSEPAPRQAVPEYSPVPGQQGQRKAPPQAQGIEAAPGAPAVQSCNFNIWAGRPLNEAEVVRELSALKRPYRFLPPGSMMTMDYSPARVNFDLDDARVVKRIWCG
ncbi:MAG: I78 family peptidase inhibitor [Alphaproteobacteria bacterium]